MSEKNVPERTPDLILLRENGLFESVVSQLEKDFNLSGYDAGRLDKKEVVKFVQSLNRFIEEELRHKPEQLRALLYRIDVREVDIVEMLGDFNDKLMVRRLAFAILTRILEKIESRKKYG